MDDLGVSGDEVELSDITDSETFEQNIVDPDTILNDDTGFSFGDLFETFLDTPELRDINNVEANTDIPVNILTTGYQLADNWENLDDAQRAAALNSLVNNIGALTYQQTGSTVAASAASITGDVAPVLSAFIAIRNVAQAYEDIGSGELSDGQVANVAISAAASVGAAVAVGAGAGGPIGAAIAFTGAAIGRGAQVAIDNGITDTASAAAVTAPIYSSAFELVNDAFDLGADSEDLGAVAIASDPTLTGLTLGLNQAAVFADALDFIELDDEFAQLGSGKSEQQKFRDALRGFGAENSFFQEGNDTNGLAEGSQHIELADGSFYNIGLDGGHKLPNQDGSVRNSFDVDFSNEVSGDVVGFTNPLSALLFRNREAGDAFVGHLTNAVQSTDPNSLEAARQNAQAIATNAGFSREGGLIVLAALRESEQLSDEEFRAFVGGWNQLWS